MDLAAQSMDPYFAQESMDRAEICGSRRARSTDLPVLYPDLTLISVLLINITRHIAVYVIGELFSKYQPGTKRSYLISNFTAATCGDAVFHTTPTPTVCYSVPSIVEVTLTFQIVV